MTTLTNNLYHWWTYVFVDDCGRIPMRYQKMSNKPSCGWKSGILSDFSSLSFFLIRVNQRGWFIKRSDQIVFQSTQNLNGIKKSLYVRKGLLRNIWEVYILFCKEQTGKQKKAVENAHNWKQVKHLQCCGFRGFQVNFKGVNTLVAWTLIAERIRN